MSEYTPRDAFAQGRFCEGGHDMANAMTTIRAGLDEFDRMIERVRAEERERCLKAVERSDADRTSGALRGKLAAMAAIRAVSEQEEH